MENVTLAQRRRAKTVSYLKKNWWLYVFVIPTIVWYIIFHYVPMGGIIIAFKRYNGIKSVWESKWVGFKWFESFFKSHYCKTIIRNTLTLSVYGLLTFPLPIIFALILNEMKNEKAKKLVQTITYAPHFISVVVLVSMINLFFSKQNGFINNVIEWMGGTPFDFLTSSEAFPHMYVWSDVWQSLGWNCIIYVAALAGVDPALHEAAEIDGASRMQRILHINIPSIMPTIAIMLIMKLGHIMSVGADKVLLMRNDLNVDTAEVITTYVYNRGLLSGEYSYSAAVGLFVNVINLVMLLSVNKASKKLTETSLF
jgi:putative aldouronate transport system permease protein